VIVTNNIERIRVTANGDVEIANHVEIGEDLTVKQNVYLNTEGGETINYGDLTVEDGSSTYLTGSLTTDGATNLNSTLDVDGATTLNSSLDVDGSTQLHNTLEVDGATELNNTLEVDGATDLNSSLEVDGTTDLNSSLTVDGLTHVTNETQSTDNNNGALVVNGGAGIGKNLNVGGNLDVDGAANFGGSTSFGGAVLISNLTQSVSTTTGALVVAGGVGIGKNLHVGGAMAVAGVATFANKLEITDLTQSNTLGEGALNVGGGASIGKNLNVGGVLAVSSANSGFLAKINNTNDGTGDGLEIKLGKTHPAWNGSSYLHLTSPGAEIFDGAIETIDGWINGEAFEASDILTFIPAAYIAGTACNLVNLLTETLNDAIGLPASIPGFQILPPITIVPEIDLEPIATIGPYGTPAVNFPTIEIIPAIPSLDCSFFPSFELPVISFVDVSNSLTNDNQYLSFKDKNNRELGSVRAESVTDWQLRFFDGAYLVNILASVVGIDFVSGIAGVISEFTNIADAYNSIGVEYASGNGDYAEWLERIDRNELITTGDIVAVKSGKITKDLVGAEQVMAVSFKPIVLGNAPAAGREQDGNKIAFMGQIPVKIQGPVNAGDYIVGNPSTPGYGIAVSADAMTAENAELVVGRAWESNANAGPKMVNTVIGVDNGNFVKFLRDNQSEIDNLETRLKDLEAKMDILVKGFQNAENATSALKAANEEKIKAFEAQQAAELEQRKRNND
jgi:hypothetical protein